MNKKIIVWFVMLLITAIAQTYAQPHGPDTLWTWTSSNPVNDYTYDIIQAAGGGFLVAGRADPRVPYIVRLNDLGDTLWTRQYPESGYSLFAITHTLDGGYVFVGECPDENQIPVPALTKLDSAGYVVWRRLYQNIVDYDYVKGVQLTLDSGFVILISRWSSLSLLKVDSAGAFQWLRGMAISHAWIGDVTLTTDGGFAVTGQWSLQPPTDLFVARFSATGDSLWFRQCGSPDADEWGTGIAATDDGGVIATGWIEYPTGSRFALGLWRLNSVGDTLWTRIIRGDDAFHFGVDVLPALNGFIVAGTRQPVTEYNSDLMLVLFNSAGDTLWLRSYQTPRHEPVVTRFVMTGDSGFALAAWSLGATSGWDYYVLRTRGSAQQMSPRPSEPRTFSLAPPFPNPCNAEAILLFHVPQPSQVTITLWDVLGRRLETLHDSWLDVGSHRVTIRTTEYASGTYFCRLQSTTASVTQPVVVLK